jgi:hypothetical protein
LLDSLLKEVGLNGHDINGLTNAVDELVNTPHDAATKEDADGEVTADEIAQAVIADTRHTSPSNGKAKAASASKAAKTKPSKPSGDAKPEA